tara:strand:+ start:1197 stop:1616 length:420 start_codon:yes stop_codon:yes gene_type:complete
MLTLTRRERFCAAHKLANPNWTDEKNEEVFGRCSNKNWHGHNYELFVTVKGEINPKTGFIIDLKWLGDLLKEKVVDPFDHRNLNLDVPNFQGKMVSTEIVAIEIWNIIEGDIKAQGAQLYCVKLNETENNSVEYWGPNQ